jgi:hypothetical protein
MSSRGGASSDGGRRLDFKLRRHVSSVCCKSYTKYTFNFILVLLSFFNGFMFFSFVFL